MRTPGWKLTSVVLGAVASLWIAVSARGGARADYPVVIGLLNPFASGYLSSARNSPDSTQYIGCNVQGSRGGFMFLSCAAQDENGVSLSCYSYDAATIREAFGIKGESWMGFSVAADGSCTDMYVDNASYTPPKMR